MKEVLVICMIFCTACMSAQHFTGVIEYTTEVVFLDSTYSHMEYMSAKYGDSLIIHIDKNGAIRRDWKGSGNPGFEFSIILPGQDYSINKFTYSDSIFLANRFIEPTQLIKIDTLTKDLVLGIECDVYQLKLLESYKDNTQSWTITVWLDADLKLDTAAYADWNEGHWNIISALNGGMYLKMSSSNSFMSINYEAVRIENKAVDQSVFQYNDTWIIKID